MVEIELRPTDYAIRMRPWFIASLVLLTVIVIGKFIISDYWGAVSLFFVLFLGFLVLFGEYGLSATNALIYSVMAMISGIFDVITCMVYFQHSKYKAYEQGAPSIVILAQTIFIACPIALFISSAVAYSIFSDCQAASEEYMPMHGGRAGGFDDLGPAGGYGGMPREPPRQRQSQNQGQFQPFQGQGHRVGS
jgi:hypothetical protein